MLTLTLLANGGLLAAETGPPGQLGSVGFIEEVEEAIQSIAGATYADGQTRLIAIQVESAAVSPLLKDPDPEDEDGNETPTAA